MAKRKRLIPTPLAGGPPVLETKEGSLPGMSRPGAATSLTPPVAQVAGEAASTGALQEMADYLATARAEGRMLEALPLSQIVTDHLRRDRIVPGGDMLADEDMAALVDSLRARGQQAPIDVVKLTNTPQTRYGLISGMRRVTALRHLMAETGEARFATVKARVLPRDGASAAYLAMVEENEIRADISFYERARIVVQAVEAQAFPDKTAALQGLFGNVSRAKRSKIGSFMAVVGALDGVLRFPQAISERRGLALAKALEGDKRLAARILRALEKTAPQHPAAEQAVLDRALRPSKPKPEAAPQPVTLATEGDRLVLSGPGVDAGLKRDLAAWLKARLTT
ncbi:MAG: ParB/RepB/Spo0J family partition protein [Pseudomonadota bacterium]